MGDLNYPLVSDLKREISQKYGVLSEDGVALRGLFIIDPKVNPHPPQVRQSGPAIVSLPNQLNSLLTYVPSVLLRQWVLMTVSCPTVAPRAPWSLLSGPGPITSHVPACARAGSTRSSV